MPQKGHSIPIRWDIGQRLNPVTRTGFRMAETANAPPVIAAIIAAGEVKILMRDASTSDPSPMMGRGCQIIER